MNIIISSSTTKNDHIHSNHFKQPPFSRWILRINEGWPLKGELCWDSISKISSNSRTLTPEFGGLLYPNCSVRCVCWFLSLPVEIRAPWQSWSTQSYAYVFYRSPDGFKHCLATWSRHSNNNNDQSSFSKTTTTITRTTTNQDEEMPVKDDRPTFSHFG